MEPTHILVTFLGRVGEGRPRLGLLDLATSQFQVVRFPSKLTPEDEGLGGAALSERYLYLVSPRATLRNVESSPRSDLLVFDRHDLTLVNRHRFKLVSDAHSVALSGDRLTVVSTGTDSVVDVTMRGADVIDERIFWRPEPDGELADRHHLNAVSWWGQNLIVSVFGKKQNERWASAQNGWIVNVSRNVMLASDIDHPHSLLVWSDRLLYCESRSRRVRVVGGRGSQILPGYARGLCSTGDRLFVGTSTRRTISKSTGLENPIDSPDVLEQRCGISRLDSSSFAVEAFVDLSKYGDEIYDLLPISGVEAWPLVSEDEAFLEADRAATSRLLAGVHLRDRVITELRTELERVQAEQAKLRLALDSGSELLRESNAEITRLNAAVSRSSEMVREAHAEIARLNAELDRQQAARDDGGGLLRDAHAEISRLSASVARSGEMLHEAHAEIARLYEVARRYEEELVHSREALAARDAQVPGREGTTSQPGNVVSE
jgi:uncharacterized small protein (DUF1192 family)